MEFIPNKENAIKILSKSKLVKEPKSLTVRVVSSVEYYNEDINQIGIINIDATTEFYLDRAVKLIKEGEYQEAINSRCSKSIFEGDFFPDSRTYATATFDYVQWEDKETGETVTALMVVGIQPLIVSETETASDTFKRLMMGATENKGREKVRNKNLTKV